MVPFFDLKTQYDAIRHEIEAAVIQVLNGTQYVLGPEVAAFEEAFAGYCSCAHGIAVNSGTSALHLALICSGIGPGDEVITTPHTFVATVASILYAGAHPVFVDIEPRTMTIDPQAIPQAINERTKAIIPVHLYGQCADMDPILAIAKQKGLTVIEDACQAHGARYKGSRAGSMGDLGCFSFYPSKNLGACGEGGIVVTNNSEYARKLRKLRDWGAEKKYAHELKGYNYRMDNVQGAILRVKLKHLEQWTEQRRAAAACYCRQLSDIGVMTQHTPVDYHHVYHLFVIRSLKRNGLRAFLGEHGIQTAIHYPQPVHLFQAYADLGYGRGSFPQAEKATEEILSLPLYPEITKPMLDEVTDAIALFAREADYA